MSQIEYVIYLSLGRKVNECIWKQESSQAFTVEIKTGVVILMITKLSVRLLMRGSLALQGCG